MNIFLYRFVGSVFSALELIILVRAFISWIPVPREHRLVRLLFQITEPVLAPVRSLIQRSSFGHNLMIDFSPIIVLILLSIIRNIILRLIL